MPLVPFRCDPHAVQEDKRGTIFDVRVEVDGEPGEIELAAAEETARPHPDVGRRLVRLRPAGDRLAQVGDVGRDALREA